MHESVYDQVLERVKKAYAQFESRIGDPLEQNTIIGPLHNEVAVMKYKVREMESHYWKIWRRHLRSFELDKKF